MRSIILLIALSVVFVPAALAKDAPAKGRPQWSMNATTIEACSCPMFCQCYFNAKPAGHGGHGEHGEGDHFCHFNNAYRINKGHHGEVDLTGALFYLHGDLGAEFQDGEMDWVVLTFDRKLTPEQRAGILEIAGHLFPVKWKSFETAEGDIEWVLGKHKAHANIDGGKTAEVALDATALQRMDSDAQMVISNLRYWGAPRNDGFVMMPNTVVAARTGEEPFEYHGTNGFLITVDINANDVKAKDAGTSDHKH